MPGNGHENVGSCHKSVLSTKCLEVGGRRGDRDISVGQEVSSWSHWEKGKTSGVSRISIISIIHPAFPGRSPWPGIRLPPLQTHTH